MIHKLPSDVVSQISLHLNQKDLLALILTNRWMCHVVGPRLYAKIVFDFDKIYKYKNGMGEVVLTRLQSMSKLLKSRNVKLIKSLKLNGYLVKNLSTSKLFKKFIKNFERFLFHENRLLSFINNSQIIDTSFTRNQEIEEMLEEVPINLLQEYKFPNLSNILISEGADLLHLSKVNVSILCEDAIFEDEDQKELFVENLNKLFADKLSIQLAVDMRMLEFFRENRIVNLSLHRVELDLSQSSIYDLDLIFEVFNFEKIAHLSVNCNNIDDRKLLTSRLSIGGKSFKIHSKADNIKKL